MRAGLPRAEQARYAERRRALLAALGGGTVVLSGARERVRNGTQHYPFRQDSDFLYLTGFPEPDAVAVIRGDGALTLFVRPRDPVREAWDGARIGPTEAVSGYGASEAFPIDELDLRVEGLLSGRVVHADPRAAIARLRTHKDEGELRTMRAAAAVSVEAHLHGMGVARAGMSEWELQAEMEAVCRRRGSRAQAYPSIVAAGVNATVLHYRESRDVLQPDDLVLVDLGCELSDYASDVTRTWPIGARFRPSQRAIYDLVLEAQQAAIARAAPGGALAEIHEAACAALARGLCDLGVLVGDPEEHVAALLRDAPWSGPGPRLADFYFHPTSHWLGLDVHDPTPYPETSDPARLEPGMCITVEPGLYFRPGLPGCPETFRGIGVRIEDDLLITESGCEVLTAALPKQAGELERYRSRP